MGMATLPRMKERSHDPRALDLRAFCADAAAVSGQTPLATLPRLAQGLAEPPGDLTARWSAQGQAKPVAGGESELWLALQAQASVVLECQRCLASYNQPLALARRFRFVRGEEEAERLDELSEDDDVLALPPRLDLIELLEDELILAIPLVPRHEGSCPEPLPLMANEPAQAEPPNPFAALAALRKGSGG
jgi:uncharacterized protein